MCGCVSGCRCINSLFCYISSLYSFSVCSSIVASQYERPHSTQQSFFFSFYFSKYILLSALRWFRFDSLILFTSPLLDCLCIESHLYRFVSFFRIGLLFTFSLRFFNVWYLIAYRHAEIVMLTLVWCQCSCRFYFAGALATASSGSGSASPTRNWFTVRQLHHLVLECRERSIRIYLVVVRRGSMCR